jgi:iron complex outermembrane receptor protein
MKPDFRQRLLATTLLVGAGLVAQPAFGQTVPQTDGTPVTTSNPTGPVEAQPLPATNAAGKPVQQPADIVVTGSRIPQPNLTSTAPVTVVTNQDIKLQGITKVEDLLNSLPSVFAAQSSTLSNGASGTAEVDLRGLGAKRTLVLVNGRRLVPGDPGSASVADLNFIPSSIVKRVEVLTGGASSTYGADAVSGVVNFIMDTNFSGIRFDGQYSVFEHNNRNQVTPSILDARTNSGLINYGYPKHQVVDGATFDGTVSIGSGFNDNRGHAVAYFGYRKAKPVLQSRRDYSACSIQNRKPSASNPNPLQCGGSATANPGNLLAFVPTTTSKGGTAYTSTFFKFSGATLKPGSNRYNFAPLNYFQRPDERYTAGFFANYEVSPAIKPYLEFMFMDDRTLAQIAPSGDFGNTTTLNCDNPLLSAQQKTIVCAPYNLVSGFNGVTPLVAGNTGTAALNFFDPATGKPYNIGYAQILRRNTEGGPRIDDRQHTSFRGVLGSRGDLNKAFSYDAYYQYGRTQLQETYSNEFSARRLTNALDVVTDNRTGSATFGQPVCRSVTSGADPLCVPYDLFTGGTPSPAALNYIAGTGFQRGQTTEQVADANITGRLGEYGIRSPFATDGVGINIGAEYRREGLELQTDNEFSTGDLTGQGAPTLPIKGSFNVKEFFAETSIPIVQRGFFEDLSVSGGYRRSAYSLSNGRKFSTDTYKLGAEFAPVSDIRFRGAFNRAVRAPNIQELFATNFVGLDGANDPCAKKLTAADAGCLAQLVAVNPGSTPGQFIGKTIGANPAAQYNGKLGGNPNLNPEVSTTKTFGVVLQPRFIPRFAITVDYFDIKVKKAIAGYGADAILSACNAGTTSATAPAPICSLIRRDASSGSLYLSPNGFIIDLPQNIGSLQTRGFETNASYSHQFGRFGSLSASLIGTYLKKASINNGLLPTYDCTGYYGTTCGIPAPRWRHKARVSLTLPDGIGLSAQWRYFGKVKNDKLNPSVATAGKTGDFSSTIAAQSYFDLASTFTVGNHFNLRIGVNNILDRQPPLVTSGGAGNASQCAGTFCNGNTYPGVYDALGRYLYTGITLNF